MLVNITTENVLIYEALNICYQRRHNTKLADTFSVTYNAMSNESSLLLES